MVDQKKMSVNGRRIHEDVDAAGRGGNGFAHDAVELCELQAALFVADLREAIKGARVGAVVMLLAAATLFAAAPVLLLSLASWIETTTELGEAASLLLTGVGAAACGFVFLLTGWGIARHGAAALGRSRSECQKNLAWLKSMVTKRPACKE